ncbi:MAG: sigma-70 family RNA polymerase sigma factor [Myxococcales bacterium]|nr:sigma-70 family RNA polymerase sigma factor [Myxococcales bacterium]
MNLDVEAERLLAERLKRRDQAAFNLFVRAYQARVFSLVHRMLGNRAEAEDLAQEVFITVFKSIDSFRGESRLGTWLYRIAVNHCKNRLKYLDRRMVKGHAGLDEESDRTLAEGGPVMSKVDRPDDATEGTELESVIRRALTLIDPDHRELIVLRDLEGLAYEEIIVITGLAEGTVKSRLHRARAALRDAIEKGLGCKLPD